MPVGFVKQTQGNQTVAATSWTITTVTATAGNTLVLMLAGSGGPTGTATAVTSAGGTWVKGPTGGGPTGITNSFLSMWYLLGLSVTPGTITLTTSSQTFSWSVAEFSGVATAGQPDAAPAVNAGAASTSHVTPTITTTVAGDVAVGLLNVGGAGTITLTTGSGSWNALTNPAANGSIHLRAAYKIPAGTGSENAAWTNTASTAYGAGILALKPTVTATTRPRPPLIVQQAVSRASAW